MTLERPTIDETLMHCAFAFAARSTCPRQHNGAVFTIDGRVLSTGYNGAPAGLPHCAELDTCYPNGCLNSVHAEANAVAFAARHGARLDGSTLYVTRTPCLRCAQLVLSVGTRRVVACEPYRLSDGYDLLVLAGVRVEVMRGGTT